MPTDPAVTERLKDAISKLMVELLKDTTQTQLGEEVGCGQSRISEYLAKKTLPSAEVLYALREYTGRPIDELLGLPPLPGAYSEIERRIEERLLSRLRTPSHESTPPPPPAGTPSDLDVAQDRIRRAKRVNSERTVRTRTK